MSTKTIQLECFEFVTTLGDSIELRAGSDPDQARDGRFMTKPDAEPDIFVEYLLKIATALHTTEDKIEATIEDDKWIVRSPNAAPLTTGAKAKRTAPRRRR